MAEHIALLLAAGGSRRLGQAKQLLRRDGETMLHRTARLALATQPARLLVVVGAQAEAMRDALRNVPCEFVLNANWEQGLSTSLRAALLTLEDTDEVLILGCDQPALEVEHLEALLDAAAVSDAGCAATQYEAALGMPVVVPATMLGEAQGDRGLGAILTALGRDHVGALIAPELAFDLDTPDDVSLARERGWLDPVS